MTPDTNQTVLTDPIYAAIRLLTEEADGLRECHTVSPDDWTGEEEAKAHYDHILAVVDALEKLRQAGPAVRDAGMTASGDMALPPPSHRHPMSNEPIWDQHAVRAAVLADRQQDAIAWESTAPAPDHIKLITDNLYRSLSATARQWYRPYRCASCTALASQKEKNDG